MNILFDLDGTIIDPSPAFKNCLSFAVEALGGVVPESLDWCIGPPLHESLSKILQSPILGDQAVQLYRKRYEECGLIENRLYPGIEACLKSLSERDYTLFLATSKPQVYAEEVLQYFSLTKYFKSMHGSELNGERSDKTTLLKYLLRAEGIGSNQTVMLGDTKFDMIGADNNGMSKFAVSYGFGELRELESYSPIKIFSSPTEIRDYFL